MLNDAEDRTPRYPETHAEYGTDPDEIFVTVRKGRPMYIRVEPGEYVREGDAFHRERMGAGNRLSTWEVTEITPTEVRGRDVRSGVDRHWDREKLERGLVLGRFSTNLTDFERIGVLRIGRWSDHQGTHDVTARRYDGRPYVTVVAYGDNGERYGRRYRFVEGDDGLLELWTEDPAIGRFGEDVRARLDERVRTELAADGYDVREA
jgi:hypothetical protein